MARIPDELDVDGWNKWFNRPYTQAAAAQNTLLKWLQREVNLTIWRRGSLRVVLLPLISQGSFGGLQIGIKKERPKSGGAAFLAHFWPVLGRGWGQG